MSKFCPECGARRADGSPACAGCGATLDGSEAVGAPPPEASEPADATVADEPDAVAPEPPQPTARKAETSDDPPAGEPSADGDADGDGVFLKPPRWSTKRKPALLRMPKLDRRWLMGGAAALVLAASGFGLWKMGLFGATGTASADTREVDLTLMPVRYGDSCGYVDGQGRLVINPQFEAADFFGDDGLAPVRVGDRWGLIDRRGQFVVNAQYENLARAGLPRAYLVTVGGQVGMIDHRGRFLINPQFQELWRFDSTGVAPAEVGGADSKWGFVDRSGAFVIPPQFDRIDPPDAVAAEGGAYFGAGLLAAAVDDRWGFIDRTGAWAVNPQFEMVGDFDQRSGLAPVLIAETTRTVDEAAASAWDTREAAAQSAWDAEQNRRAQVYARWGSQYRPQVRRRPTRPDFTRTNTTRKWGYVDRQGRIAIARQYDWARPFNESGLAPVNLGQRWGYIDARGQAVVPTQYRSARAMRRVGGDWVGVVQTGDDGASYSEWRYGLIDSTGAVRITPQFNSLSDFEDGRAVAGLGGNLGVVDVQGRYIVNPGYSALRRIGRGGEYLFLRTSGVAGGGHELGRLAADGRELSRVSGDLCGEEQS